MKYAVIYKNRIVKYFDTDIEAYAYLARMGWCPGYRIEPMGEQK